VYTRRRILHLIADPFPVVWHTLGDDATALDFPTIEYINKELIKHMLTYFVTDTKELQYLRTAKEISSLKGQQHKIFGPLFLKFDPYKITKITKE
jgi:hypothetical protein